MSLTLNQDKPAQEQMIDLGYYYHLIKTRWASIFLFAFLCTAISVLVVLSITPTYKATATLLIEASQKKAVSIEEVVGIDTRAAEYYLTQFEILKSNQVAQRVIDKLNLEQLEEFNPSLIQSEPSLLSEIKQQLKSHPLIAAYFSNKEVLVDESTADEALNRTVLKLFKSKLTISPIRKTQLVYISFESQDPKLAATIANEVGQAFIDNNLESKLLVTAQATGWINQRLEELKQNLDASEEALLAFLQKQKLIDDSGISALTSSELSNLTERLSKATDKRIETQALYNALKNNKNADIKTLTSISLISNHPQVRDIRLAEANAEKEVSELSKRYGPKHDRMIRANAQLASIQKRANELVAKLINGIGKELSSAREQERLLEAELLDKKGEFQALSVVKREYDALKREVDTNANLYDLFLTRQKETSATSDFNATNARITDYALIPELPSKPNKKLIISLAFVGSFGLYIVLLVLQDMFNSTIDSMRDFEKTFGLLPTGSLPKINCKANVIDSNVFNNKNYLSFSESVDSLRTSLLINFHGKNRKMFAISSSVPGEGKTTCAITLAHSFSKLEKVLIVDCDLRKPSVAPRLNIDSSRPGVGQILLMGTSVDDCICELKESRLHVLPAGMLVPNPQQLLSGDSFDRLISTLEKKYDRIIFDTPPILPVKDAFIIGKKAGGIMLVLKANSTTKSVYRHATELFSHHEIYIDGVVINQASIPKKGVHTYSAYSQMAQEQASVIGKS
ncbi:polysaccharide biosynthesis tyrosine autokinase [Vibrio sp. SCSIO 43136]|uniref:GumC family protein n=1 Tax=Vibrio sp. SCSIO 43136 TaxID=2819101 RepID=UPI0020750D5F|nr:polysaccharide biosynthesis tyrosine autokinase [Vibrio sp. SCSIO 43136]USD67040.1 polysaccharide biosynthesis tyrosine autokinase [Vibrio sp. SCSIO 43136]